MTAATLTKVEFLYGTFTNGLGVYVTTEVVAFRIAKKTPKRIYYFSDWIGGRTDRIRFVDRQVLEADGEVWRSGRHWDADIVLYLEPPDLSPMPLPDHTKLLSRLKAEMAAVHPDRGGTNEEFIAARARYEQARKTGRIQS